MDSKNDNMEKIILLVITIGASIILINVYLHKLVINRALTKFIIPHLNENGLTFVNYKSVGFFKFGDFKPKDEVTFWPFMATGSPVQSIYIYVFYKEGETEKRVTVKINVLLLFIKKVIYSGEL